MSQRTAVYRFFAADDSLLYVGIADDPDVRQYQHSRSAADTWWPLATRRTDEWFGARSAAERAEIEAIVNERPRFNVKDNPHHSDDMQRVRGIRARKTARLPNQEARVRWKRVATLIEDRLSAGEYLPGCRIPVQALALETGVSTSTVKRACQDLEGSGLLQIQAHGHVVPLPAPAYKTLRLPINRPLEAAGSLREAMSAGQLAALIVALQETPCESGEIAQR